MEKEKVLEIKNLNVSFKTYAGISQAVRGVDFDLYRGEALAIVGESGCGKTVTSKSIMGLFNGDRQTVIDRREAEVNYQGKNLLKLGEKEMARMRGSEISMIFQDPMSSLNPTMKIGKQIAESILIHEQKSKEEAMAQALEMLELVRIPNARKRLNQYPFEFSGGMRQRAMIAIALASRPKVLIADEPTTALDVTIQAQIMELIGSLQKDLDMSVILVTHDLGVVAGFADRIQVMYAGKIVERGTVDEVFYEARHPYTHALLKSVPKLSSTNKGRLFSLTGTPPDMTNPPSACPFAARCIYGMNVCREVHPKEYSFSETQSCTCWLHDERADTTDVPDKLAEGGELLG